MKNTGGGRLVAALIFLTIFLLYGLDFFEGLELKTIDYRFFKNPLDIDCNDVAVVEITGECLEEISSWPVKRAIMAKVIDKLAEAGAKTIAIDVLFADRTSGADDDALAATVKKHASKIVLASQLIEADFMDARSAGLVREKKLITPHAMFACRTDETGLINIDFSGLNRDGVIRKISLAPRIDTAEHGFDVLSLKALKNYYSGTGEAALKLSDDFIQKPFFINYYRGYRDSPFIKTRFSGVLSMDTSEVAELVRQKLVFIGVSAPAVPDMRLTPFGVMPGVEIHATIAGNVMQNKYAYRVPALANFIILAAASILLTLYIESFRGIYDIAACAVLIAACWSASAYFVAFRRTFIDLCPFLALITAHFILMRLYQNVRQVYIANLELQKMVEKIGGLYNIAKSSYQITDLQKLLNITVVEISKIIKCKRVSIVIEDPKSKSLILKAAIGFENTGKPIENLVLSRKSPVITKVMETGEPLIIKNIDGETGIKSGEDKENGGGYQTKSFICLPIMYNTRPAGALSLTDKDSFENFTEEDLKTITVFANQISSNIEHVFHISDEVEKKRLGRELEIASSMQKKLIPAGIKNIAGYEIFGSYIPAKEVSGDYYDCIELDEDHLLILVGDVSGKGVPAGLFMMMVRTFLHIIIKYEHNPAQIMNAMNDYLTSNSESTTYLTVFLGVLDVKTGDLEYASGGHLPPIVIRSGGTLETLDVTSLICGMFPGVNYDSGRARINAGDTLFIFTDGVTEAQANDESMYGNETLCETLIKTGPEKSAADHVNAVLTSVKEFVKGAPQSDDITILALKSIK